VTFEVRDISKRFGLYRALDSVSLRIARGELVALLGPSGCGKTTLLRILAGLEMADSGTVHFEGTDVTHTPAAARGVGLVFQHYALFEHMTVFDNVAFGLRVRGTPKAKIGPRVRELLARVRLDGYADRAPSQLSGGQRQRVALARALASEPKVMLLDEPFGALDAGVRHELRAWLRRLHDETHVTTVLVTHDREDAFELADRVAIMNEGRLEQVGPPADVFRRPATEWVMRFLGHVNEVPVHGSESSVFGYARPHELDLSRSPSDPPSFGARVRRVQAAGALVRVELEFDGNRSVVAEVDEGRFEALALQSGDSVFVSPRLVRVFDPQI